MMDGNAQYYAHGYAMPQAGPRTYAPQPYTGPVYSAGASQASRPGMMMPGGAVGLDLNRDGRADLIVAGADLNQDGLDGLQGGGVLYQHAEFQDEEPLRVAMVVPEGAVPGTKLQYAAPDGQELRLTVPDGVPAGSVMTLTQDPITKQWKCMAEPAEGPLQTPGQLQQPQYDAPAPVQQQSYGSSVNTYTAPATTYTAPERVTYVGGLSPVVTTYTQGQAPTTVPRTVVQQTMPVNLSYVPPPSVQQQPSVTQVPAALAVDPSRFNPPRQRPDYPVADGQLYMEQRPSYTPPPVMAAGQAMPNVMDPALLASSNKVQPQQMTQPLVGSYVPPPCGVMQNNPSYVPPMAPNGMMQQPPVGYDGTAASVQMPAGMPAQGPSITTLPTQGVQQQPMLPMRMPNMQMMGGMPTGQMGMMPPMAGSSGLSPLGQMPGLGGQMMGPQSMGMLGPGTTAPLGSGLVPPGATAGPMSMMGGLQQQQQQQQQLQQQLQQQQLMQQQQLQQQQMMGMGMQPGQMPYQMPGMAPPLPYGGPMMPSGIEGMGGMPGMMQQPPQHTLPHQGVGAPQAY